MVRWVSVFFFVVVRYGDPSRGVRCGLHCHYLLGGACGVGRLPVENMCGENADRAWFVVPMGFIEKTGVLLTCFPCSCCRELA
jgi:hypothetical protein